MGADVDPDQLHKSLAELNDESLFRFCSEITADVMGADVAPNKPLMEAGLNSLAAVELRNAVATRFGMKLPATTALDYPTLQVDPHLHLTSRKEVEA
jgi:acyl carrier protein